MSYDGSPSNKRSLEQRLRNLTTNAELANRRRITMGLVVVGQMLPEGAVKGGSAMALRYGRATRFTSDLDAARSLGLDEFVAAFEDSLRDGWAGFTGRLIAKNPPTPAGIPGGYVMQPFEVKLDYKGSAWCTVKFELGHNEIGDADQAEQHLAPDLATLFTELGLQAPAPIAVMRTDHQIAQKLHAVSAPSSERARDLVDLQLLAHDPAFDAHQTLLTCRRLFEYRKQQVWPPSIEVGNQWPSLYAEAARGLDVAGDVQEAVDWANGFIRGLGDS